MRVRNGAHDNTIGTNGDGVNDSSEANRIRGNSIDGVDVDSSLLDFSRGFPPSPTDLVPIGSAQIQGNRLHLTDAGSGGLAGAFATQKFDVSRFSTSFQFQLTNAQADGFTFTIQGQDPGTLGASGGALGYGPDPNVGTPGIGQSVAIKFDLFDNNGEGNDSTGLFLDGAEPFDIGSIDLSSTGIDLHSGDLFQTTMTYDGTTLSVTILDTQTRATATQSYQVNIPGTVGGPAAYVGFTAATGYYTATQDIVNWSFASAGSAPTGNRVVGNVITANGTGVVVLGQSVDNPILANRIDANAGPAIDLGGDGVTYNSSSPRQGPNNLQNFPIIVTTAAGGLRGWLGGSTPDTTYRIDVFASAAPGPGGAGEAQDYLGSLTATTDSQGQAVFDVPFALPAGMAVVTATATDPQGNTSEISAVRRATLLAPAQILRDAPGQPLIFSAASGNGIVLQDPDAGVLDPEWDLTLSVAQGTLALSRLSGLVGSGNGTGTLHYRGPLSALNAALDGLSYTQAAGSHGNFAVSLNADSEGAAALQARWNITDGFFTVTTSADAGPGSLRQAILDADGTPGPEPVTICFSIPGQGVQAIAPLSALPAITRRC